jgi:hypothetical protein
MTEEKQDKPEPEETPKRVIESDDNWFENWPLSDTAAYRIVQLEKKFAEVHFEYLVAKRRLRAARDLLEKEYSDAGLDIRVEVE